MDRSSNPAADQLLLAGTPLAPTPTEWVDAAGVWDQAAGIWDMVADGAGHAWVKGPWELTRVDVVTGAAEAWDVNDMAGLFSPDLRLAATSGDGVWLLVLDQALLFDGHRITRRLHVPAKLVAKLKGQEPAHIHDLVEVDDRIWVSVHSPAAESDSTIDNPSGIVLRWSDQQWTAMSRPADTVGGALDVDDDGSVWAGGWQLPQYASYRGWDLSACRTTGRATGSGVRRWDGKAWNLPGSDTGQLVPGGPGEVVSQGKSTWYLSYGEDVCSFAGIDPPVDGAAVATYELLQYASGRWQLRDDDESTLPIGTEWIAEGDDRTGRTAWLAPGPDGQVWVAGDHGLIRVTADGQVKTFTTFTTEDEPDQPHSGLSQTIRGLVVTDTDTLVLDGKGLSRLVGDNFEQVWAEPFHWAGTMGGYLPLSKDSLIASTREGWYEYTGGTWIPTAWPTTQGDCKAVLADDGAIWIGGSDGLARVEDGRPEIMVGVQGCPVAAAGEGRVWFRTGLSHEGPDADAGGSLELVSPDGGLGPLELPKHYRSDYCVLGGGLDGSMWIAKPIQVRDGVVCGPYEDLARWDGRSWAISTSLDLPGGRSKLYTPTVAADGSIWGWPGKHGASRYYQPNTALIRYDGHKWSTTWNPPPSIRNAYKVLIPAPGDRVCVHAQSTEKLPCLRRYGSSTTITNPALAAGSPVIAPDGAIWILGDQIARLPQTLPALTP